MSAEPSTTQRDIATASSAPARLPAWADYVVVPLVNVVAAFLVSGLAVLLIGENPIRAAQLLVYGALGYGEGIGFTLFYATNFIFTGLAVAVAFHAGLFNIGGEGQAYLGGLGCGLGLFPDPGRCSGFGRIVFLHFDKSLVGLVGRFLGPRRIEADLV